MKIELFYFDDCPSYEHALRNLTDALAAERLEEHVEMVPVLSEADAVAKRFLGSPTIRVNGVDTEGKDADQRAYAYGCRVYVDGGKSVGWPSVEQLRRALRESLSSSSTQ